MVHKFSEEDRVMKGDNRGKQPFRGIIDVLVRERDKEDVIDADGEDHLVVLANILSFQVRKILVDIGSLVDILTTKDFYQMGLKDIQLKPTSPIHGFANQLIVIRGSIVLSVVLVDDGFPSG
ncbi:hypothetical protein J1N35_022737 [Gossypium stocksii]|uniref:Uncharacterized protein n=1 Tax=Gossypium stocksii TaxID=47602 RepID=A0A9D3VHB6_9ROSI|nr:hypothetical protein J1N35_022737 [Gossypium stocksii]